MLPKSHFGKLVFLIVFVAGNNLMAVANSNLEKTRSKLEDVKLKKEVYLANFELADSLVNNGDAIRERTSKEIQKATNEMQEKARLYRQMRKDLDRNLKNATKMELGQQRLAIREMDREYREELKIYDQLMKDIIKESELATREYVKGMAMRRQAEKDLRESAALLQELQEKINDQISDIDIVNN